MLTTMNPVAGSRSVSLPRPGPPSLMHAISRKRYALSYIDTWIQIKCLRSRKAIQTSQHIVPTDDPDDCSFFQHWDGLQPRMLENNRSRDIEWIVCGHGLRVHGYDVVDRVIQALFIGRVY